VLDHDDGIRPVRDRGSGHDLRGFSCGNCELGLRSCAHFTNDAQGGRRFGHVGVAKSPSIAGRAGEGRKVAVRWKIAGKDAPMALQQRDGFRRCRAQPGGGAFNDAARSVEG
jgi:hypothetical protein